MKRPIRCLLLGLLSSALASNCATSPTGRKQLILVSDQEMATMGVAAFDEMKTKEPIDKRAPVNQYVACVVNALINANSQYVGSGWEVLVFDQDLVNAFALPGKKVGVYKGMIDFAASPDELAAVVGHELAHVVAHHGNERVSESLAAQGAMSALSVFGGEGSGKQSILAALGLGYQYGVALPHSRGQESEADEIGLEFLARAGFNPAAGPELWLRMAQNGGGPPEFLSTHPDPAKRAQHLAGLQDRVAALKPSGSGPNCPKPASR